MKDMNENKKTFFFIDDVIWVFRDLTRKRPASLFDNPYMKVLKEAHDRYGMKVQLHAFYRTDFYYGNDEFTLADMTDAYKAEWEEASDWIKIGFHSKQEFPDYPFVNATYEDAAGVWGDMKREIIRFAGEKSVAWSTCAHWGALSKAAVRALHDGGIRLISPSVSESPCWEYNGDPASLPYGHAGRLLQNRQPETKVFSRGTRNKAIDNSLCGYNYLAPEVHRAIKNTLETVYDGEMDVYYKKLSVAPCLNLYELAELEQEFGPHLDKEFIGYAVHEQYFYEDYFAYQPEYAAKILKAAEILSKAGYTYFFAEEMIEEEKR